MLSLYNMTARMKYSAVTVKRRIVMKKTYEMAGLVPQLRFGGGSGVDLTLRAFALAVIAVALISQTMQAQTSQPKNGLIDNFTTGGTGSSPLRATSGSYTDHPSVALDGAEIFGGSRYVGIWFGSNEFVQTVQMQVTPRSEASGIPSAMIVSAGFDTYSAVELIYPATGSLNLNMTSPIDYNRFRLTFAGLAEPVDFAFDVWDITGNYSEVSCEIGPFGMPGYSLATTVDIPTASFGPTVAGRVNWSNITAVLLEWGASESYGMGSFAITEFSALTSSAPAGTVTCGAPAP
jgi:hypothetical protein